MALQIRRGTNSERILITPLPGELIYVTDYLTAPPGTNAVYVGDGSTAGGVPVAVSPALAGTMAGNISLGGNEINGSGNISITGNISNTGTLTVTGNIVGTGNISRTGNITLVGDAAISGTVTAGTFEGELLGSVFGDDSSGPLVNAIDATFTGNQITINSPVSSRSITLVDNSLLFSTVDPDDFFFFGEETNNIGLRFYISKPINHHVAIPSTEGDNSGAAALVTRVSRGLSSGTPENIQQNDILGGNVVIAFSNDTFNNVAGFCQLIAENQTGAATAVAPASWVWGTGIVARDVSAGSGDPFDRGSMVLDSQGVFRAPVFKASSYSLTTPGDFALTPAAGMIIFDSDTSEFKGYNGTSWVVLG